MEADRPCHHAVVPHFPVPARSAGQAVL